MDEQDCNPEETSLTCEVCQVETSKYKCPRCKLKYCSVPCFKVHRTDSKCFIVPGNHVPSPTTTVEQSDRRHLGHQEEEEGDRVPVEKLQLLERSEEVMKALRNPHLRQMMLALDTARHPAEAVHKAMLEPIFVEFVDACLQTVEPGKNQTWPLGS